jgi:glycosyltransferase involved in cell wall biosynthesis
LYKGCFFEKHEKKVSISSPIKIVYAGNLFYGRWEILKLLADEIERINTDSVKMFLEIYTTATITHEIDKALNRGPSSCIMGALPYEDIKKVLQKADIVLHVESFEPKQIKSTRLSFSTKIIDCMQSGSCMMAIGPSSVASIQYLSEIEGSIVVDDLNKLREVLKSIINNPNIIIENAEKLNQYARVNHNLEVNRDRLKNDFREICNSM